MLHFPSIYIYHSEKWQLLVNTLKNHFFKSNRLILRGYVSEGILDIEYFENLDWPNLRIVGFSLLCIVTASIFIKPESSLTSWQTRSMHYYAKIVEERMPVDLLLNSALSMAICNFCYKSYCIHKFYTDAAIQWEWWKNMHWYTGQLINF